MAKLFERDKSCFVYECEICHEIIKATSEKKHARLVRAHKQKHIMKNK